MKNLIQGLVEEVYAGKTCVVLDNTEGVLLALYMKPMQIGPIHTQFPQVSYFDSISPLGSEVCESVLPYEQAIEEFLFNSAPGQNNVPLFLFNNTGEALWAIALLIPYVEVATPGLANILSMAYPEADLDAVTDFIKGLPNYSVPYSLLSKN